MAELNVKCVSSQVLVINLSAEGAATAVRPPDLTALIPDYNH